MNYYKSKTAELLERKPQPLKPWSTKNLMTIVEKKMVEGRMVRYATLKEIDQKEVVKNYNINDFSIENLEEIGAIEQLTEGRIQPSTLMTIDMMEKGATHQLDILDAEEWARKYLKKTKKIKASE